MRSPKLAQRSRSLARRIARSQRAVTILFTDIESSTAHWDKDGDIEGRLLVDRHNRLVFSVIQRHKGRVVKTIGDAVMAAFRRPSHALAAAVGIQQVMERARADDPAFDIQVRIGIHTGRGLVERDDVFGHVVNLASRIESRASGGEILISAGAARGLKPSRCALERAAPFVPKGTTKPLAVLRCNWRKWPSQIEGIALDARAPALMRQRCELLVYAAATGGIVYYLAQRYARYLIADTERGARLLLDPAHALGLSLPVAAFAATAVVAIAVGLVARYWTAMPLLRGLCGGFGLAVGFGAVVLASHLVPAERWPLATEPLYRSKHVFVEVLADDTRIRAAPSVDATVLRSASAGELLLLADVRHAGAWTWSRVWLGQETYGWVARTLPATPGSPERRLTLAYPFTLGRTDIAAAIAGLLGFVTGTLRFRIRPL
jgi:class 3 adenylate cyclase